MRTEDVPGGRKVCCSHGPGGAWASETYSCEADPGRQKTKFPGI